MTPPLTRLAAALLAAFLVTLPAAALAQDATPAADLAADFPDTLGGNELAVETFAGQAWLERMDAASPEGQAVAEKTQALLDAAGASIDDLTIATALYEPSDGNHAAITAVEIAGASAADLVSPTIGLLLGDVANPAISVRQLGSRHILRVADADQPGAYPRTVYPMGDTVWVVEAEQPVLLEIVEALPGEASQPLSDPAPVLAGEMPFLLGDEPRYQLQISSGWGDLLSTAPGEMFGPQFEDAEVRLYLTEGLTADDLSTALGIWNTAADGTFILGFKIGGADEEVMRAVMDEVIIPSISVGSQQPTTEERDLAGQRLTVVSDQGVEEEMRAQATYNFVVAGDTVWMVNLASADDAVLTEAVEALTAPS
jgi:hypothetical protein